MNAEDLAQVVRAGIGRDDSAHPDRAYRARCALLELVARAKHLEADVARLAGPTATLCQASRR